MPTLPSGRRIEFSLDRFHAMLSRASGQQARRIVAQLNEPEDLLPVLDAVHFSLADGSPYFAGYVAADWATRAADWNTADRQALQAWLLSPPARQARAEAVDYIRGLLLGEADGPLSYPYVFHDGMHAIAAESTHLRQ